MLTIAEAIKCDDQPINGATIMGESRFLTSWITPDSLEIQEKYRELTQNISGQRDKIIAVWQYVKNIPYTQFVSAKVNIGGRVFSQHDAWLDPAQALRAGVRLNCMNKSILLASLLRQDLSADKAFVCLNNVNVDGWDGHAVVYLRMGDDYLLETTNPSIKSPFLRAADMDIYEAVIFFNDQRTLYVPDTSLREPLTYCHCIKWLEDYINERLCDAYI